mgnify:CR=1 FL=1
MLLWYNDDDTEKKENYKDEDLEKMWDKRIKSNEPKSEEACERFFKNATACINERTKIMIDELIKRQGI